MNSNLRCDACGAAVLLDPDLVVAAAQLIAFVAAHNGHEDVAVRLTFNL